MGFVWHVDDVGAVTRLSWAGHRHASEVFGFEQARYTADGDSGWKLVDRDQRDHCVGRRAQDPELRAKRLVGRHDAIATIREGLANGFVGVVEEENFGGRGWEERVYILFRGWM
jgi:hypothetical protein